MDTEIMRGVILSEGQELIRLADAIDYKSLACLEEIIRVKGRNVFFTGCGTSAMAARKCSHTLQVIGSQAFYLNPSDAVHGGLGAVRENDVVVVLSKGGTTKELMAFLPNLHDKGVIIVVVGEKHESPIGKMADLFVKIRVDREPDAFNMLATASTLAVIAAFDALAISLMNETHFTRSAFLANHPSGDVGNRLAKGQE